MDKNTFWQLAAYGASIAGASLFGGWLLNFFRIDHRRMQIVMAFVAGLVLGVAILHLLPHSLAAHPGPGAVEAVVGWMMAGLIVTLVMMYIFDFHEHGFSAEHGNQHDRPSPAARPIKRFTWVGIALGLGVHSLTEGLTLSSVMRLTHQGEVTSAGFGVFLAIALHKPLDALAILSTMRARGLDRWATTAANLGFALLCPAAAFVSYWAVTLIGPAEMVVVGCVLAFATGSFLCISLHDLLPAIHFHSHDRVKLATGFLIGLGIAYALHWVEPSALHGWSTGAGEAGLNP